ncbi:MAG TPA: hypothetical protein V6D30_03675 [Leptolyngbyaceae cyanobacterium]
MTQMISPGKKRVDELFELMNTAIANYVNNVERASEHWAIRELESCLQLGIKSY